MAISTKMQAFGEKSSWIRKMFEQGEKMKAEFGAENVFDFSLGNPDVPPPRQFDEVMQRGSPARRASWPSASVTMFASGDPNVSAPDFRLIVL